MRVLLCALGVVALLLIGCSSREAEAPAPPAPPSAPSPGLLTGPAEPGPPMPRYLMDLQVHANPDARQAAALVREKRLGEATQALGKALQASPEDPTLLFALSSVEREMGLYAEAWDHMLEAEKRTRSADGMQQIRFTKVTSLSSFEPDEAIEMLEEDVKRAGGRDPGLSLILAEALATRAVMGNLPAARQKALLDRAEELTRRVLKQDAPELGGEPNGTLGCVLWARGDLEGAIENFEAALKRGIHNVDRALDIHGAVGWLHSVKGNREAAVAHFDKIVELTDDWSEASYYRALPKRENALVYREILAGEPYSSQEMAKGLARLDDLEAQGISLDYRQQRVMVQRLVKIARLREQGKPREALGETVSFMEREERPPGSDWVRCFFLYQYDWPLGRSAYLTLAGNLAAEAGEAQTARNLYKEALDVMPENPAAREALKALGTGF